MSSADHTGAAALLLADGAAARTRTAGIAGVGMAVPPEVVTNEPISERLGVDAGWIESRTGIRERRHAAPGETLAGLAVRAGRAALADAGVEAADLDLVLVATVTPDQILPNAAPVVAHRLGAVRAGAMDIGAACTGFVSALSMATAQVETGRANRVLVIGAETLSRFTDPDDRRTAGLFADGAGAAVVGVSDEPGIGPVVWGSDGAKATAIQIPRRGAPIEMEGQAVFRLATTMMGGVALEACRRAGVAPADIAVVVPHQANLRIVDAIVRQVGATHAIVARDIVDSGNTSAASVPLALSRLVETGEAPTGEPVLLLAFGAGLTFAGQVIACP